jgi:hypothetical protein
VPLLILWLIVLLEILSPVPAFLTLGAAYVLLFRPPRFLDLVLRLYGVPGGPGAEDGAS